MASSTAEWQGCSHAVRQGPHHRAHQLLPPTSRTKPHLPAPAKGDQQRTVPHNHAHLRLAHLRRPKDALRRLPVLARAQEDLTRGVVRLRVCTCVCVRVCG